MFAVLELIPNNMSLFSDTACCLNPFTLTYYNFDDHDVKEATAKQVKASGRLHPVHYSLCLHVHFAEWRRLPAVLHITGAPSSQGQVLTALISVEL